MRNYKLLSWVGGIALGLGIFGAEAMAQPAPPPAPAPQSHSWLHKPLHENAILKSVPKDKLREHQLKANLPPAPPSADRPLPPPRHVEHKGPAQHKPDPRDPRFEKKPMAPHEKRVKDGPGKRPEKFHGIKHKDPAGPKPHNR